MTIEDLIVLGKKYTSSIHAKMLLASFLNVNSLELLTILDQQVDPKTVDLYQKALISLQNNKPLQYVIGNANFYGINYTINENVLIPRFETEELVENIKNYIIKNNLTTPKILDLGTGSGVIGLTLKKFFPTADVTLTDISPKAWVVAKTNATNLNLNVTFIQSKWLDNVNKEPYDIIVSNPPYIKEDEEIEEIVKNNEPHLALYGGKSGLDCYQNIINDIKPYLKEKYLIAFEIGYQQGKSLETLIKNTLDNVKITIKQDLSSKDRMLFVEKNID